ncbi:MAG: hypothetical protein GEV28_12850 [Actinophytocola sp.]|uniref:hypothetical protein n=1 Tax=Actinophytocola sp. TaxID=1872138 RepID=UPI0013205F58|nr:hypothetical protein [Actinophytocola sp.]MPZ81228.1 hypothetical protein [Actinophytocola sp.]
MGPRVVVLALVLAVVVLAAVVAGVPVGLGVGARSALDWFGTWGSALLAVLASRPDRRGAAV